MGTYLKNIFFKPHNKRSIFHHGRSDVPLPSYQRERSRSTSLSSLAMNETHPVYGTAASLPKLFHWVSSRQLAFIGSEREDVNGRMMEIWGLRMRFVYANLSAGIIVTTISRTCVQSPKTFACRRTVYSAEIVDNENHFFHDKEAGLDWENERKYWGKFKPFDSFPSAVRRQADRSVDISDRRFVFMRLRALDHVLNADEIASDKSSRFAVRTAPPSKVYYLCIDLDDGQIIATLPGETNSVRIFNVRPDGPCPRPGPQVNFFNALDQMESRRNSTKLSSGARKNSRGSSGRIERRPNSNRRIIDTDQKLDDESDRSNNSVNRLVVDVPDVDNAMKRVTGTYLENFYGGSVQAEDQSDETTEIVSSSVTGSFVQNQNSSLQSLDDFKVTDVSSDSDAGEAKSAATMGANFWNSSQITVSFTESKSL